jgi:hypothetical protein
MFRVLRHGGWSPGPCSLRIIRYAAAALAVLPEAEQPPSTVLTEAGGAALEAARALGRQATAGGLCLRRAFCHGRSRSTRG